MKCKTYELSGAALDWAVAGLVHSENWRHDKYEGGLRASMYGYNPSTNWSQGGVLIEKHLVKLIPWTKGVGRLGHWQAIIMTYDAGIIANGSTALVAAMRAIVRKELGNVVDVPEEIS